MRKKLNWKKNKRKYLLALVLILVAFLAVYLPFFNGSFLYFTTGLSGSQMLKTGGTTVSSMEADILLSDAKIQYEGALGTDAWNTSVNGETLSEYVKAQIRAKMIRVACMNEMAKDKGIVLSREEKTNVSNAADEFYNALSASQRSSYGVTKEKLQEMFTRYAIADDLYTIMTENYSEEISKDEARVIAVQYICTDSEEAIQEAQSKLQSGQVFYALATQYNQSGEYETELKRGEMEQNFEDAAYDLKTGEVSDIVQSDGKYYLIKCTSDNEQAKTDAHMEELRKEKKLAYFNSIFEPYEASEYVEFNSFAWKKRTFTKLTALPVQFQDLYESYFQS